LEFLADGGYMVETIAKLQFPEGKEIEFDSSDEAVALTSEALKQENITLFEATFLFGQLLARVDILEKRGNCFRLIEVKSKGFKPRPDGLSPFRGERGGIISKWQPYLEDVAFQTYIVRSLYPNRASQKILRQTLNHLAVVPSDSNGGSVTRRKPRSQWTRTHSWSRRFRSLCGLILCSSVSL